MLRVDGLEIQRGNFHLGPLSYSFSGGSLALLRGPNGSGKTTFLKTIAGRLKPKSGVITVSKPLGAVGLEPILIGSWTLNENATFISKLCGQQPAPWSRDLQTYADQRVDYLSAGLKRRSEIEIILGLSFGIYLFDEPLNTLDQESRTRFIEKIHGLKKSGKIILIATHDEQNIFQNPDQVVEFK